STDAGGFREIASSFFRAFEPVVTMDELRDALTRLDARLQALERRVGALEASVPRADSFPIEAAVSAARPVPPAEEMALPQAGGLFPVVGKAMLGIAGAYLLRAVAESGSVPKMAVVALALVYAATWMVWASRAQVGSVFTCAAYAATSALILVPMLAELTLRFQVLSANATGGLLSAFVIGTFALSWKRRLAPPVWVAVTAVVLTAIGLLVASHDLAPYIAVLLVAALIGEFSAGAGRWLGLRFVAAPAADAAIVILIYINSLPESSRPGYATTSDSAALALPTLLFFICAAGVVWRSVLRGIQINVFEITQATAAFVLAAAAWLLFAPARGPYLLGICCWLFAAGCYTAAFVSFDRFAEQRNYHVYATWAVALVLAGSFLLLSPALVAAVLSTFSIAATVIGVRVARLTPDFHGLVYLTAAAYASGFLRYAARALAGTFPSAPGGMVWMVAVAAIACFAVLGRSAGERWNERLIRLFAAILAISALATFLVSCLVWLAAIGMTPGATHVAVIRTLITCGLALALAAAGSRWRRVELVWTSYGLLAVVSAKLLFEDLPHGHSATISISIFLYAVALIMVPRVSRIRRVSNSIEPEEISR
ncbi:MAG: hypothetical protein WB817_01960, partial [Terriglobales bacterium]